MSNLNHHARSSGVSVTTAPLGVSGHGLGTTVEANIQDPKCRVANLRTDFSSIQAGQTEWQSLPTLQGSCHMNSLFVPYQPASEASKQYGSTSDLCSLMSELYYTELQVCQMNSGEQPHVTPYSSTGSNHLC